ncbi:50S ribosomal protein L15e [Candidatus Bathyarchaeota archaeon]|nr:50S ribosomal protein L15e [Candidatus Bathyarchaeota archaeon]MBS7627654.1 50S ribosomal protein L15e [Candidatus Bathyarchaeota archaeon]
MATSAYKKMSEAWRHPEDSHIKSFMTARLPVWRRQPSILRISKPTKLHRARALGYKAKQGYVVVRVRIRRGSGEKTRPRSGRRQKALGVEKIKRGKSKKLIAEERAAKHFPNLKVLNSYLVWEDGIYKWFEVILVDPNLQTVKVEG